MGLYESGVDGDASWEDGDWNGDGNFSSSDFVTAFSSGGYETGPRPEVVPEPATATLALFGCLIVGVLRRRFA